MLLRRGVLLSVAVVTVAVAQPRQGPSSFLLGVAAVAQAGPAQDLPLEPTRRLRLTTDEGTWMSLDVSPDGETIVFDLLGDLYTVSIEGGQASRITEGMAFDAQPRYSPDGRSIVFVSDRNGSDNVWIANADGTNPRKLTSDERDVLHFARMVARRRLRHRVEKHGNRRSPPKLSSFPLSQRWWLGGPTHRHGVQLGGAEEFRGTRPPRRCVWSRLSICLCVGQRPGSGRRELEGISVT